MQTYDIGASPDLEAWDRELDELYAAITGRSGFRYEAKSDPLFAAYEDRAVQNGRLAMRDTMGRTAGLTGGYASSYGQAVGQQQYGEYLRSLSEAMPEFYQLAYQQWQDEGERLLGQYDRLSARRKAAGEEARQAEQTAYDRSRDALADQRYAAESAAASASAAEKAAYARQKDSYAALVKLISASGYRPTDAELRSAGLSREAAEALLQQYLRDNKLLPEQRSAVSYAPSRKKKTDKKGKTGNSTRSDTPSGGGGGLNNKVAAVR